MPGLYEYECSIGSHAEAGMIGDILVVDSSTSLQALIDNANLGSTVTVDAGIYHESININKSIELVCENQGECVIDPIGIGN